MSDLGQNIRSAIVGSTAVKAAFPGVAAPGACQQATESQDERDPRIWFARNVENEELELDGTGGLVESFWDLEVISEDQDSSQQIAAVVKRFLHGKRGALGNMTIQGCFCSDHDDQYIPQGVAADSGYHVASVRLQVFHTST